MKDVLALDDIARELRVSRKTVQRLATSGKLPTTTISRRGGFTYVVPIQSYFDWKKGFKEKKEKDKLLSDWDTLKRQKDEWLDWCRKGLLTGKPLSDRTVEIYGSYLNLYWKLLPRRYNKTTLISVNCLREVFGSIDIKSYSTKKNIYDAIRSFVKFLITKDYCNPALLTEIQKLRPRRLYPAKRLHCSQDDFEKLLAEANKRYTGQSDYDVILNSATIATIGFTGLRASELCSLRLQDIDLVNRKLFVYLGKGKKNRSVGICNRLYEHIARYLQIRPKATTDQLFLIRYSNTGGVVPLTRKTLLQKVKRLSRRIGIDINLHGLRRTFATIAANAGKPINIISLALGHADLKTTQGYLMTSQDEVVKEMCSW